MAILKETIKGTNIICEIESSNITKTDYNTESKKLIVDFKTGIQYEYDDVPHEVYTRFRMAESQGSYFSKNIAKAYKYKRL
jgi:hypothetical protein